MPARSLRLAIAVCLLSAADSVIAEEPTSANLAQKPKIDFARQIRPILSDNCFTCHGPDEKHREADLRLDTREGMFADRDGSPVLVVGDHAKSLIYERITSAEPDSVMPPPDSTKKLTEEQKQLIARWIDEGAVWGEHWAFVKPVRPAVPKFSDNHWVRNPIDAFILKRMQAEKLAPSPEAGELELLRRVYLDLTGLPPTLEEIQEFQRDEAPDAYEKLIDRLLTSPRYGEHLARYWLDLARYGDTHGLHLDNERQIWPYRDWVVNAFNRNLPYDQFIIEQLAGDLLPNPTDEQRIATGFNRCNVTTSEGGAIDEEFYVRYNVDRVDTFGTVFLGLTLGCAVCHDHKFDPISQKDFYQLFAYFNSTPEKAMDRNAMDPPPAIRTRPAEERQRLANLSQRISDLKEQLAQRAESAEAKKMVESWLTNTTAYAPAPGTFDEYDGIVGLWTFDEPDGDVARSVKGDLPPGQLMREPTHADGKFGRALYFRGGPFAKLGNVARFDRSTAFSLGAWLSASKDSNGAILAKMFDKGPPRGYDIFLKDGHIIVHLANSLPENAIQVRSKQSIAAKEWLHVFVTYDGSSKAAGVAVYINGLPVEAEVETDALSDSFQTDVDFQVARRYRSSTIGKITVDDVRVYGRKLSATEVAALANINAIDSALKVPAEHRTPQQVELLRNFILKEVDGRFREISAELEKTIAEQNELEKSPPIVSLVMKELPEPRDAFLLDRGLYDQKRDKVERKVPAVLPPLPPGAPNNRLGLGQWLVDESHPLTARVAVNHFWQNLFGTGLVTTSEDFGSQGMPPSHPELLDWLAVEFQECHWDVKKMLKMLVTSSTYRQSSRVRADSLERDPLNVYLARGPRFRLDAEVVRDQALYVSGLLVERVGGKSVKPYQPPGLWEAVAYTTSNTGKFVQDKGDALYRRGMYTFWKRTSPPPTLTLLDAPSRESCTPRRTRTNSPTQALALMNDVQFVEAARHFAARSMKHGQDTRQQAAYMFRLATSREPSEAEVAVMVKSYEKYLADFKADEAAAMKLLEVGDSPRDESLNAAEHAAWTLVGNMVLNLDEVLTKN